MASTPVDALHREFGDLLAVLDEAGEISLRSTADANFRKALLLAAASYFERQLTDVVVSFAEAATTPNHVVAWLIKRRVVERQYHTWFDWGKRNANRFFSMFGDSFRGHMIALVNNKDNLSSSIQAFMEIGRERNRMVHQDYGSYTLEKTSEEIYQMYRLATEFVERFSQELRRYSSIGEDAAEFGIQE